jgi:anti-sigma regulatory factor (Ser/Thr protein kinase)
MEVPLPHVRRAPREARDHLEVFLDARGVNDDVKQHALVIASELVTNAVVHASEPIMLQVGVRDGALRVEVCDGDDRAAFVAPQREGREDWAVMTGRGLAIVESLAKRWGVRSHRGGKSVWAEIDAS